MTNLITGIKAEQIYDSRNKATLKVSVFADENFASFEVPSGASTGISEAFELRDIDGSMKTAISKIENIIEPVLLGKNIFSQKEIDQILINLDGTKNKSNLGGNSILGVSIACLKLGATLKNMPIFEYLREIYNINNSNKKPYLYMNLINGGKHAKNNLAFQEYQIIPIVEDPQEALNIGMQIQKSLKEFLESNSTAIIPIGDEGGFAPTVSNIKDPLYFLQKVIHNLNLKDKVRLGLDVAATSFFQDGFYTIDGKKMNNLELIDLYQDLITEFNLLSIEDPFEENDFKSFSVLKEKFPNLIVIGDDLTTTNKDLLTKAISEDSINAILIKPNQIGTFSETMDTILIADKNNIKVIVSHRSGETVDDFIADLAFSCNAFGLKAGAPSKKERLVKYNRLIEISK